MSAYSIELPFAPGETVWYCATLPDVEHAVCPECDGSLKVIVETRTGRYEVPCETCSLGYEGPHGYVTCRDYAHEPVSLVLGRPSVDHGGGVWYFAEGETSGQMHYADSLFRSRDDCAKRCAQMTAEHTETMAARAESQCRRGRTEAARAVNYRRGRIKELQKDLAFNEARLKVLESREKQ